MNAAYLARMARLSPAIVSLVSAAPSPPDTVALVEALGRVGVPAHDARHAVEYCVETGAIHHNVKLQLVPGSGG